MENQEFGSALSVPGYARLARDFAYDSKSYAAGHPSLPNYLALTAGSTFGVTSDCLTCYVSSDNLGAELSAHRVRWDAYLEDVQQRCYLGTSYGDYAAKHNPFRYYEDVRHSRALCDHLLPYTRFSAALRQKNPPQFMWVTPNVCDDGHSCPQNKAASWLKSFVRTVTRSRPWRAGGLLIVTWDEGDDRDTSTISPNGRVAARGGGGHILTILATPRLRPGTVVKTPLTPYGILALLEENFRLPLLHRARAWGKRTLFAMGA